MSQVPLAPPPPTGGPLDSWLYLLWRRLTQAGQILWETITPGTSADVAAVVTDETGSPGSLVFSANPTLQGATIDGVVYQGDTTAPTGSGITVLGGLFSTNTASGTNVIVRKCNNGANAPGFAFLKARGTASVPTATQAVDNMFNLIGYGHDGTNYIPSCQLLGTIEGTVSTGVVSGRFVFNTANSSGTLKEAFRIDSAQAVTLGGDSTAPALKVTPVASQARWIEVTGATSSTDPAIGTSGGNLACSAVFMPKQATTAGAPTHVVGGMYFDTTLNKLRIGGAAGWETVTSV